MKHESCVAYAKSRVEAAVDVVKLVTNGYFVAKEPASEALVAKLANGLRKSKFAKPYVLDVYRDYEQSLKAFKTQ